MSIRFSLWASYIDLCGLVCHCVLICCERSIGRPGHARKCNIEPAQRSVQIPPSISVHGAYRCVHEHPQVTFFWTQLEAIVATDAKLGCEFRYRVWEFDIVSGGDPVTENN